MEDFKISIVDVHFIYCELNFIVFFSIADKCCSYIMVNIIVFD